MVVSFFVCHAAFFNTSCKAFSVSCNPKNTIVRFSQYLAIPKNTKNI